MIKIRKIFHSFTLDRMITEFSWEATIDPSMGQSNSENHESTFKKYRDIFLNSEFIRIKSQSIESIDQINKDGFVKIDIQALHDQYFKSIDKIKPTNNSDHMLSSPSIIQSIDQSSPKSSDYIDKRLFITPDNLDDHLLDRKKIGHLCAVHLGPDFILFDANFEQLTYILKILSHSIEFNSLIHDDERLHLSSQTILPSFNTHSYSFSFNISEAFSGYTDKVDLENAIIQLLSNEKGNTGQSLKINESFPLQGYKGIDVLLSKHKITSDLILKYMVTNSFTKSAKLLDITAIQKTSLIFIDRIIEGLIKQDYDAFRELYRIRTELEEYIS